MTEPVQILKLPIFITLSADRREYVFSGTNASTMHRKFINDYGLKFVKPLSNGKFQIAKADIETFLSKQRDPLVSAIKMIAEGAVTQG